MPTLKLSCLLQIYDVLISSDNFRKFSKEVFLAICLVLVHRILTAIIVIRVTKKGDLLYYGNNFLFNIFF